MATKKTAEMTYQQMRQQLDEVILQLQDPDCDVDQAAGLYEQALALVKKLEAHLEAAENRIKKVQADFSS